MDVQAPMTDWPLVVVGGPWPQRIGLRAREVPQTADTYPWNRLGRAEVVVLIENDPLCEPHDGWTCCLSRSHVAAAEGATE